MQSEIANNPEVKTPVKTGMKTRSQYRMSQQSNQDTNTHNATPVVNETTAKNEPTSDSMATGSKASHKFSQESIQAMMDFDAKPVATVEQCSTVAEGRQTEVVMPEMQDKEVATKMAKEQAEDVQASPSSQPVADQPSASKSSKSSSKKRTIDQITGGALPLDEERHSKIKKLEGGSKKVLMPEVSDVQVVTEELNKLSVDDASAPAEEKAATEPANAVAESDQVALSTEQAAATEPEAAEPAEDKMAEQDVAEEPVAAEVTTSAEVINTEVAADVDLAAKDEKLPDTCEAAVNPETVAEEPTKEVASAEAVEASNETPAEAQ